MVFSIGNTIYCLKWWNLFIFEYRIEEEYDSHLWIDGVNNCSVSVAADRWKSNGKIVDISMQQEKFKQAKEYIKEMLCK